ncbi:MAG: hypothetical protein QOE90_454 [Thermoplasmata archaeon]|jgi:hypothetical protein|nr:hypothetical protein [Thermoplasmata archaeon]
MSWRWEYVDDAKRHRVVASPASGGLVVDERDLVTGAAWREVRAAGEAWEVRALLAELEADLALAGRYWKRVDGGAWEGLRQAPGAPRVDLAPVMLGRLELHALHAAARERLVLAADRGDATRMLAALEYPAAEPEAALLQVLHGALPEAGVRAALAREHARSLRAGFTKLSDPRDLAMVHGPGWRETLATRVARAVRDLREDAPARPAPASPWGRAHCAEALARPAFLRLEARYLKPGERERLVLAGPQAIRRHVAALRARAPAAEQHLLSVLEACLRTRHALASVGPWDAEAADALRHAEMLL